MQTTRPERPWTLEPKSELGTKKARHNGRAQKFGRGCLKGMHGFCSATRFCASAKAAFSDAKKSTKFQEPVKFMSFLANCLALSSIICQFFRHFSGSTQVVAASDPSHASANG
jgi:hypothetical protein